MATNDNISALLAELDTIDAREDRIVDELLRHGSLLEQAQRLSSAITSDELETFKVGLQRLRSVIDEVHDGLARSAETQTANGADSGSSNGGEPAGQTLAELAAQVRAQDSEQAQLRALMRERLGALGAIRNVEQPSGGTLALPDLNGEPVETGRARPDDSGARPQNTGADAPDVRPGARPTVPRTLRLQRPLMRGKDVETLQKAVNRRFAAWGVGLRVRENGVYDAATRNAAWRVARGLGLRPDSYTDGFTARARTLVRTPSRRTPAELDRARANRPWLNALRKRYPATRRGAGATGALEAAIRAHHGRYEDIIVRQARAHGLPVSLVCAVIELESGFRNIFGRDGGTNPVKSPPPPAVLEVTEPRYREYLKHRTSAPSSFNGVGVMQLTWDTFQDRADELGGCWKPEPNIRAGVEVLARNIKKRGLRRGIGAYNGSGPDAERYAERVLARELVWRKRLQSAAASGSVAGGPRPSAGGAAARPRPSSRVAATPRVFVLTQPLMEGADVLAFQRRLNARFDAWGIARDIAEDGRYGAQTQLATRQAALALGLNASSYKHGATPRLRVLIRTPSRRSARELRRARTRRPYREKLRKRYGSAAVVGGGLSGSPKEIIDTIVLPLARRCGINVTPASVKAANDRHGPTIHGKRSDHQGPPNAAWAADMSNGSSPTPEMDNLAAAIARRFGIPWTGSGLVDHTVDGYKFQLIYRTDKGGNHHNHVHCGIKKL